MTEIEKYTRHSMSPFRDMLDDFGRTFRDMDRFMQNFMNLEKHEIGNKYRIAMTNWEIEDKKYTGTVELPGIKKEEIKINAIDGYLEILAEHYEKKEDKNNKSESKRRFSTYERLPEDADIEHITSAYDNGILTLNVPRLENLKKTKSIEIKVQ